MRKLTAFFVAVVLALALAARGTAYAGPDDGAAPGGGPAPAEAPVRLRDAVRDGLVTVAAKASRTFRELTLEITNLAAAARVIDVAGAHFEPKDRTSCQRLGLGPVVTASAGSGGGSFGNGNGDGSARVTVPGGETVRVTVATCCLDVQRHVPRTQTMVLAPEPLAPKAEALFRRWADRPWASQWLVNSAVWQGDWEAELASSAGGTGAPAESIEPKGVQVRLRAGVAYVLRDGLLRAVEPDGNLRFLGTGIHRVLAEEDGTWVVAQAPSGGRKLRRVPVTAESSPKALLAVDPEEVVESVLAVPSGTLVVTGASVRRVALDGKVEDLHATRDRIRSAVVDARGRLLLSVEGRSDGAGAGRFTVRRLDLRSGETEDLHRFTNVRDVCLTGDGAFSLSDDGVLQRLGLHDGRRLDLDRSLLASVVLGRGPACVWIDAGERGALACDPQTGRLLGTAPVPAGDGTAAAVVDPQTGDLAWVEGARVRRFVLAEGRTDDVPEEPPADPE